MSNIDKHAVQAVADLKAGYTLGHADVAILNELARIALASLEAEPVAYIIQDADARSRGEKGILRYFANISDEDINEYQITVTPLYTAPTAPVVPDDVMAAIQKVARIRLDLNDFDGDKRGILDCLSEAEEALIEVVNRRAAMLQGAEPVTTAYKLPANTPCKDAPEHIWLQTAGVWPENGEFSELTWCSDNQHKDDTLYVRADVVSGNSPAIPDGWKLVPVIAFPSQWAAGQKAFNSAGINKVDAVYKAMVAAAPQQEVK
ncbi:DUF551 domain-containing protein [Enterobacter roggenkampii]|uniref:DUF551 domain-containing protein n=1 Tax=Enterobacter roggenkampii TaxID=1812935 RepID=UPI001F2C33B7|nr:DUF551 domain-containing protein [Enterobacter roggenkampii]MCE5964800.1 DUF551 domain-containing protein [Enterobacter roggenkampii]MCE5969233.1 DUF551 domain-containing protein [Enterobacter roggenkampii]UHY21031.1 DUF551 domain-containing protein [Enterobacter roggenkampii]